MADVNYPLSADDGLDDLPRTLRREKEARQKEARERDRERERSSQSHGPEGGSNARGAPDLNDLAPGRDYHSGYDAPPIHVQSGFDGDDGAPLPSEVTRLNVPFFHLVGFFIKAAFAAIPAVLLLGGALWGIGHLLQTYFPWLVKMQIFIHFPS